MRIEYRLLGPIEVLVDGETMRLGGPRQRAVLAVLALSAGRVAATDRIVDEVWPEAPPETATNLVQGYVSDLRKAIGRDAIETREPGYLLRTDDADIDLHTFERLATDGAALVEPAPDDAATLLASGLELWRGPALADLVAEGLLVREAARLDELRYLAEERRLEAELERGRHVDVLGALQALVDQQPLREHPRELLMLALYRAGRQADALAAYRAARSTLVDELGIEPGAALQELERRTLAQDPSLDHASRSQPVAPARRRVLVAALEQDALDLLAAVAQPLAREAEAELVLATTVPHADELDAAAGGLRDRRQDLVAAGLGARAAAFTSLTPGVDLARLAAEQEADLVLADAPASGLEDARLLALLDAAPCDVGIVVRGALEQGPICVPFTGVEHDWAAVELAAWLARATRQLLTLVGARTGISGRDASRLLANASLVVQRALGVDATPILVEPEPQALVAAAADASVVVVGLTDRWRHEGLGRTRTALVTTRSRPTILMRKGLRPGGLAPRSAETRFTWTLGQTG